MSTAAIKAGDVVELKSGGPKLIVKQTPSDGQLTGYWVDDQGAIREFSDLAIAAVTLHTSAPEPADFIQEGDQVRLRSYTKPSMTVAVLDNDHSVTADCVWFDEVQQAIIQMKIPVVALQEWDGRELF